MAPLPHNSTDIYYLDYNTGTVDHTMQMRTESGFGAVAANDAFDALLNAAAPGISTITIVGMRFQAAGTNFSTPVAWTGAATYGTGTPDRQNEASYWDFVGRDSTGRRVRISIFGSSVVNNLNSFRDAAGGGDLVEDVIGVLASDPNSFITIAGNAPTWKGYANVGLNSYWQRQFR